MIHGSRDTIIGEDTVEVIFRYPQDFTRLHCDNRGRRGHFRDNGILTKAIAFFQEIQLDLGYPLFPSALNVLREHNLELPFDNDMES